MKKVIVYTILFFACNVCAQQKKISCPSEIYLIQNGKTDVTLIGYAQLQTRIKGKFGLWAFGYTDKDYAEAISGPYFMNKFLMFGLGAGYEFYSEVPVIAATFSVFKKKNNFYSYAEVNYNRYYWYQAYYNRKVGFKEKVEVGIYAQTYLGIGLQLGYKFNDRIHLYGGCGYRLDDWSYGGSHFVPRIVVSYGLNKKYSKY